MKKSYLAILLIFAVLAIDQALKIYIKTSFCYGEERAILGLPWAKLHFVENAGMAFGWQLSEGDYGKLALSLFRIVAIAFLIYYVRSLIKRNVGLGLISSFSLILAGAIGNIIDSALYGIIFSNSDFHCSGGPAKLFPQEGGYGTFLHGKVVDMLFFPLWHDAKGDVLFFQPVFNIADSAITVGVLSILLFQRQYFNSPDEKNENVAANENTEGVAENATETTVIDEIVETPTEEISTETSEIAQEVKTETDNTQSDIEENKES